MVRTFNEMGRLAVSALIFLLVYVSGCAERMGSKTTAGALQEFQASVDAGPGQRPAEAIAARAVKGAIEELSQPDEIARIDMVSSGAANSFRSALTEGLTEDLGEQGRGPLAATIAEAAERASTRAVQGAMATLLTPCDMDDPTCLDRRVADLSTRAARAFSDGVKESIGLAALVIAFVAGAAVVLLALAVWAVWRGGQRRSGSKSRALTFESTPSPSRT